MEKEENKEVRTKKPLQGIYSGKIIQKCVKM